jgi:hypothetical protein
MRIAILHNFYRSSVPSGENEVVQREFESLIESGISSRLVKLEETQSLRVIGQKYIDRMSSIFIIRSP